MESGSSRTAAGRPAQPEGAEPGKRRAVVGVTRIVGVPFGQDRDLDAATGCRSQRRLDGWLAVGCVADDEDLAASLSDQVDDCRGGAAGRLRCPVSGPVQTTSRLWRCLARSTA